MEMVVVFGITAIIITVISGLFVKTSKFYRTENTKTQIQLSEMAQLSRIIRQIRLASSVAASGGGYTTGATTLVLQLPSLNSSNAPIAGSYDYVIYKRNTTYGQGSGLQEITIPSAGSTRKADTRLISPDNIFVSFFYYDSYGNSTSGIGAGGTGSNYPSTRTVYITLQTSEKKNRRTQTVKYIDQATLRN